LEPKRHYHWIDLLRFLSALLVVLAHYRVEFFVEYGLLPESQKNIFSQIFFLVTRFGEEPVLVFFVLSGFLVGGRAFQKVLNNDIDVRSYAIDRSVRILLPLFAASLFVILIDQITNVPVPWKDIIGSIFSLQGIITRFDFNPPLWSLAYEVWFYILMACIMVVSRGNGMNALWAFLILAICTYVFVHLNTMYLLILLLGTFAFFLPRQDVRLRQIKIIILVVLLLGSFLLVQATSASNAISIDLGFVNREMASIVLALITSLLVNLLIVSAPGSNVGRTVDRLGSKLADFSYTLYLTHFPLMSLLSYWGIPKSTRIDATSICYYVVAVSISLLTAYLIYLVSEKQTDKVKKWIKGRVTAE